MNKWRVLYNVPNYGKFYTYVYAWEVTKHEQNSIIIDNKSIVQFSPLSTIEHVHFIIDDTHVYNGIEVLPTIFNTIANKASQWSAYLCLADGGKQRVARFDTEGDARDFAHELLNRYHSLTRNVIDCCDCEICHNSLKI